MRNSWTPYGTNILFAAKGPVCKETLLVAGSAAFPAARRHACGVDSIGRFARCGPNVDFAGVRVDHLRPTATETGEGMESVGNGRTRKIVHVGLAAAMLLLVLVVVAPRANAYNYLGCKFPSAAVNFYSTSSSFYGPRADSAAAAWNSTQTSIDLYTDTDVNYELEALNSDMGNSGFDGMTYHILPGTDGCPNGNGNYAAGVVITSYFNQYYANLAPYNGGYAAIEQVYVHEIGHAFGLAHAGAYDCASQLTIMYASSDRYFRCGHVNPQINDRYAINNLY